MQWPECEQNVGFGKPGLMLYIALSGVFCGLGKFTDSIDFALNLTPEGSFTEQAECFWNGLPGELDRHRQRALPGREDNATDQRAVFGFLTSDQTTLI